MNPDGDEEPPGGDAGRSTDAAADADVRVRELKADVEAFEETFDDLAERVDALARTADAVEARPESPSAEVDEELARAWVDLLFSHRSTDLLLADLRAEFEDLRERDGDEGVPFGEAWVLDDDFELLRIRWNAVGDVLDDCARPAWRERFGETLSTFESDLDVFEPPIDWGEVEATVEEARAALGS